MGNASYGSFGTGCNNNSFSAILVLFILLVIIACTLGCIN
ncbi:MAG: sporulation protein YjcZ [Candidatus Pristimantibacillus lignocellulolyticus]|uniref:Sporulation protein YjcZ n=1 Tax=Candidatus Pristimantibacillus lignocellulolyticus TaxID=2994561 RepID=A0A9J6ZEA4_9BACL|nr:MAG: sporulation protein YjcZ [Candidatus Pristimantibacillus lignocellulolyticus]